MLRSAAIALAAAALAATCAAPAVGADAHGGKAGGGEFRVMFDVVTEGGEPKKVKRFEFRRVVMTCETGPTEQFKTRSESPFGPFRVSSDGRFGRRFVSDNQRFRGETVIRGEFVTTKRVRGMLRIQGDYPDATYAGCDSGRLEWRAALS